ncbi:MAG: hypothetical protein KJO49_02500 [Bacteroidia bacterium]|nr:hypothetical protein [Bacteroidia bacterium]MBT8269463.1 hypothetical protein [Bacteroidia bacterium]NNF81698.1 hypothetical protein [Flavobacteriaceae bacterium]NNK69668.1 hypothetical protein [Flavobacteriaceae bacterium]NNL79854.1 hypothetical protein [Flavobacteriaceae bacterium]
MKTSNKVPFQFILGLILALGAGVSMYFGTFPLAARITVGIVGIALIATSKYRLL